MDILPHYAFIHQKTAVLNYTYINDYDTEYVLTTNPALNAWLFRFLKYDYDNI